jgi:hypothetical protein
MTRVAASIIIRKIKWAKIVVSRIASRLLTVSTLFWKRLPHMDCRLSASFRCQVNVAPKEPARIIVLETCAERYGVRFHG